MAISTPLSNSKIKFSIIVPVYNVERYLMQCLDSIAAQTFGDFEVICVNDGSTDNSYEILRVYADKDHRFKIISQKNQGQGVARNVALKQAQGEYLIFVDADDFIEADTLATLDQEFQRTAADLIQFNCIFCAENGKTKRVTSFEKRMLKYFNFSIKNGSIYNWQKIQINSLQELTVYVWNKAYKSSLIKENQLWFPNSRHGEDHLFSIGANLLASKILYLNRSFYHYRDRPGSAVNRTSDDNFCVFENVELLKKFLISKGLFATYQKSFTSYMIIALSKHYFDVTLSSANAYLERCKTILNKDEYAILMGKIKPQYSFWERLFSIKKFRTNQERVKILTVLGFKFKLKSVPR